MKLKKVLFKKQNGNNKMSIVKKRIIGVLSGKVHDLVFRSKKNISYVASAPAHYSAPQDASSVLRRSKFGLVVKLSSAINKLLSLKLFWKRSSSEENFSIFNKILKTNYKNMKNNLSLADAELVQESDFIVTNPEINILANSVTVSIDPLGAGSYINPDFEKTIAAETVLYLSNPIEEGSVPFRFIGLGSADINLSLTDPLTFTLPLIGSSSIRAQEYVNKQVLVSLVTKDDDGKPVKASGTLIS